MTVPRDAADFSRPPTPSHFMPTRPTPDLIALLARHRIFGHLDDAARAGIADAWQRESLPAGAPIAGGAALHERLWWVLSGQVTLATGRDGSAVTLGPGDCFGAGAGPDDAADWSATADGRTVLASVPAATLQAWLARHRTLSVFLATPGAGRPPVTRSAETTHGATAHDDTTPLNLMSAPLRALVRRAPVTVPSTASIAETARTMRDQHVSSVLLIDDGELQGIVTDRDLRIRALAAGLDPTTAVREIATASPLTADAAKPAFEALLLMARHNIHHVPVLDGKRPVGMITATDLTQQHSTSPVYLAGEIHKQTTVEDLAASAAKVRPLQGSLAAAGTSAYSTGHIVTAITDAITTRLLQLGEERFGPAPLPYAWVAAGSQARNEQTAKSDQDNCMLLDDAYDEATHGAYFKALANFVNDGLDASGYIYCPGEMMARTDEWRQPVRQWTEYFHRWTDTPEPKALMLTCVFFDLRLIHGSAALLDGLRRGVLQRTRHKGIFLAHMVGNALTHRPPLSFFGGISTVHHGERRDTVDLKHNGIVPIVDLARIYALAIGHEAVNTHDRLAVAAQSKEISEKSAHDLRDALEFMASLRIRHQAGQIARGEPADNFLSLSSLSNFEQGQLKDAFGVVQTLQSVLAQRYR